MSEQTSRLFSYHNKYLHRELSFRSIFLKMKSFFNSAVVINELLLLCQSQNVAAKPSVEYPKLVPLLSTANQKTPSSCQHWLLSNISSGGFDVIRVSACIGCGHEKGLDLLVGRRYVSRFLNGLGPGSR